MKLGRAISLLFSLISLFFAGSVPARAQNTNGLYSSTAQTLTYIQSQYVLAPLSQATITVCNYPATQPSLALPCTNLALLYAGPTTSTPASAAFSADSQGNFSFWALPGYYAYTVTNILTNTTTGPYSVVISPGTSGGGGGGGATFPFPGLVFATNSIAGTVATSAQIVAALNLSPSTLLAPALLPTATNSTLGAVRPDGTSITINSTTGVISSSPPMVSIPATSSVLKGSGSANTAAAAQPGTDYVIPSGSILGSAASLSAASTLPNGTVGTTQTVGDNTTKLATDAFVLANAAPGASTPATSLLLRGNGSANGVVAATPGTDYVIPSGTVANLSGTPALPNGTSATTQTLGDSSTKLATDAFVLANSGSSTIPATTSLLKGSGSANVSVAATPGTDYLLPSALPATSSILKGSGTVGSVSTAIPCTDFLSLTGCAPTFTGITVAGTGPGVIKPSPFSAAGTPLPTCNSGSVDSQAMVSDATAPSSMGAYTSGGTITAPVVCSYNGTSYTWLTVGGAAGTPGGSTTDVQINSAGSLAGYSGFTYNNSTQTMTVGPLGTATSGSNFNSGISQLCDSYWTGSAAAPGCWTFQDTPLSGTNPYDILTVGYAGSPQSGQINFNTFARFQGGFGLNASNGSGLVQFKGPANMPSGDYSVVWPASNPTGTSVLSCTPTDSSHCTASWVGGSGGGVSVTPQQFGGYGDAYQPPDGFNTTASSTTVIFNDAPLTSTAVDGGKHVWITGAGASGVAFSATITTVIDNSTAVLSAAPSATLSNARGVFGHDDVTAIQTCWQYSATNAIPCAMVSAPNPGLGLTGFLVGSGGLQFVENNALEGSSGENIQGNSQVNGTNLFCEYNGNCITMQAGGIQGLNFSNISIQEDRSQPASRGMYLEPQVGIFGTGVLSQVNFTNISVYNPALECMWLDGGGGPGYGFNLPNQYLQFTQFWCSGPPQSHPANLIKITGQMAQVIFINGQVNGDAWNGTNAPNYPNPMINITEKTSGLGDTPVDVKFYGYTFEVGTQGLYIGNGANNIHFDNSYVEDVSSPFIISSALENTFNGNHIANSGNIGGVYQFSNGGGGSVRDNYEYGGAANPAAFATCSSNSTVDFANNISNVSTTTGCATTTESTGGGSLTVVGSTASVTATGNFNTINASGVAPGKNLTLYNAGSSFQLTSGGNISFGDYAAPLTIPAGGSVTLTLLDASVTWLVTAGPLPSLSSIPFSSIVHGANTDIGAFSTAGDWTFDHQVYMSSNGGTTNLQLGPGLTAASSSTCIYDDGNFNFNATCNGNRGIFFKGSFSSSYIAAFQPPSGTNVLTIGLDGSLNSSGALHVASARKGTFTCTGGGTITITNANEQNTSDVVISLNSQGGTITTPPAMKTVSAGTGFTVLCGATDTSTYNYDILN